MLQTNKMDAQCDRTSCWQPFASKVANF